MRREFTMLEVVRMIKSTQDELDELYKKFINPATDARSMVSLYNPNSGYTINGAKASEVNEEIRDIDKRISMTLEKLEIITSIKEQVNSSKSVTIYDEDGNPKEYTIAQLLMMSSPKVKKYHLDYLNKLEQDYNNAVRAQASITRKTMSDEKVSMYVNAKMNSLHITDDPDKLTYGAFAQEYRNANVMSILDPLNIGKIIAKKKESAKEYYDRISLAITIFNATTKVWIDFDDGVCRWGFVGEDEQEESNG